MNTAITTKIITLELDAYEKLLAAKRGKESFSSVVRYAIFPEIPITGNELLAQLRARGPLFTNEELDNMETAVTNT